MRRRTSAPRYKTQYFPVLPVKKSAIKLFLVWLTSACVIGDWGNNSFQGFLLVSQISISNRWNWSHCNLDNWKLKERHFPRYNPAWANHHNGKIHLWCWTNVWSARGKFSIVSTGMSTHQSVNVLLLTSCQRIFDGPTIGVLNQEKSTRPPHFGSL